MIIVENKDLMGLFFNELKNQLDLYSGINHNIIIGTNKKWMPIIRNFERKYNCKVIVRKHNDPYSRSEDYWYIKDIVM